MPARLRDQLHSMESALESGRGLGDEAFAEVEIIPGPGFEWDQTSKSLKGRVPASALGPQPTRRGPPPELREILDKWLSLKK